MEIHCVWLPWPSLWHFQLPAVQVSHIKLIYSKSQKTLAETQRDLARSQRHAVSFETEQAWSDQLLESERNANKNLQVALAAASDSALAVDRLSKQISDTNKRLSSRYP